MASANSIPSTSITKPPGPEPPQTPSKPDSKSPRSARPKQRLARPLLGSRKSSGTIIIPRDSPTVEVKDEQYDPDDARAMSPRRNSEEIDKMGDEARHALEQQANQWQADLLEMIERADSVKTEHEKLDSGNKFLQSYIGELMQTSKITSAGAGKPKGKGRVGK